MEPGFEVAREWGQRLHDAQQQQGGDSRQSKGPDGSKQLSHEQARKHQAHYPQRLLRFAPPLIRVLLVADEQADDEIRKDARHVQRDEEQDGVVAGLGREELLGARAGGVQGGVLAMGRQPVDVLVDVVVGRVGLGATVGAQKRLSAVAVAGATHADGWGWDVVAELRGGAEVGAGSVGVAAPPRIPGAKTYCFGAHAVLPHGYATCFERSVCLRSG